MSDYYEKGQLELFCDTVADGVVGKGGEAQSERPLSTIAALAVDLGPADVSATFRKRRHCQCRDEHTAI